MTETVGYHEAKKQKSVALYLRERDQEDRIRPPDDRLQRSRAWLAKYLAPGRSRPSAFNWAPRWPVSPPGEDNGKEIIEGDYAVVADVDAASEVNREELPEVAGGGEAASGRSEAPQGQTDFTEEDRTPF
jgi:hypothetical protein